MAEQPERDLVQAILGEHERFDHSQPFRSCQIDLCGKHPLWRTIAAAYKDIKTPGRVFVSRTKPCPDCGDPVHMEDRPQERDVVRYFHGGLVLELAAPSRYPAHFNDLLTWHESLHKQGDCG